MSASKRYIGNTLIEMALILTFVSIGVYLLYESLRTNVSAGYQSQSEIRESQQVLDLQP